MKKEKEIPLKNYIILSIILIITALIAVYFYMGYNRYEESKLNTPIIDKYLRVINYNELDDYLVENKDAIIYTSILENEEIRNFEIKFKNAILNNSLRSSILYMDLTEVYNNQEKYRKFINNYTLGNDNITITPAILTFENSKLIKIYNIKDNNYEIEKILDYLKEEGIVK